MPLGTAITHKVSGFSRLTAACKNTMQPILPMLTVSPRLICLLITLPAVLVAPTAASQEPSIQLKTSQSYIYQTGDKGLQPFIVTINNPTAEALRDASFSISMPAGMVLGSVDLECDETVAGSNKTLSCTIQRIDAGTSHVTDFFVDGPLSQAPNGLATMSLSSEFTSIEQSEFDASLTDADAEIYGASLSLQLVRDILFDGNNNTIPDIDEQILQPRPDQSFAEIMSTDAVLDVLFLTSSAAESYLGPKLKNRVDALLTASNEVFSENGIFIKLRSVGVEAVPYSGTESLEAALDSLSARTDAAFSGVDDAVQASGADLVVLLHALAPAADSFCAYSSSVALGRMGDFQPQYHLGQMNTVIDVGPDCIDLADLAASVGTNMGLVSNRDERPNGGTFPYSAGFYVSDQFRTIMTRISLLNMGMAEDLNRFSDPNVACKGLPCGLPATDLAQGANAVLSLNQTRHVVSALNPAAHPVQANDLADKRTPSRSNGIDIAVTHGAVESGALMNAFAEFKVEISNTFAERLHNLTLTALHLENGLVNLKPRLYRFIPTQCSVSGATLTDTETTVGSLNEKFGRLTCYIDFIDPGETIEISYFIGVDLTPPELDEGAHYYHEVIAINGNLQQESAACIPVYSDLLDASIGSNVCDVIDQLSIANEVGDGFLDLEALPTITGNIVNVPFIRLNDSSLISAIFQVVNFGSPELELLSYQTIDGDLTPLTESRFDESNGRLSILALGLEQATYNLELDVVQDSDPIRFNNLVLVEVAETDDDEG